MCIAIITTEHPQYPFILLNNRDEYLHRPTAEAQWWPEPDSQVLGGYDLHRPAHGTWLGVTRQGRIAVLTNFRDEHEIIRPDAPSRGVIPNAWLKQDPEAKADQSTEQFAEDVVKEGTFQGVGGFSLVYGKFQDVIQDGKGLAIISNRTMDVDGLTWIANKRHETRALSNAAFGDRTWPKVVNGERLARQAVLDSLAEKEGRDELVERLLGVLSTNTLPNQKQNEEWDMYLNQLRYSIFIPPIGRDDLDNNNMPAHVVGDVVKQKAASATTGCYGTQKQICCLVDKNGKVFYVERTLFDNNAEPVEKGMGDRKFEFSIEGW